MLSPALLIAIPLAAAALLLAVLDRIPRRIAEWFAIAIAALTLAGASVILRHVVEHGSIVEWVGGWHPGNRVGLGIALGVDPAAASVGVLVATAVFAAVVYSYQYFEDVGTIFYVLILAMLGAMMGFSYAADAFNLFVWYEVFSVSAYALATYRSKARSAYAGALQFALTNSVAGLFFLMGISIIEGRTGELNLAAISHSLVEQGAPTILVSTALAFVAIGLFTRGALVPLGFWFDEVHAAAPAPLSAILSGAMVPLALYGFARIYWVAFATALPPTRVLEGVVMAIGALAATYGTLMTLRESRFKRKLAHATVAHSGVALAAIGAFSARALAGAAIYEASYAAAAGALFFTIAILSSRSGEDDVKLLTGAGRRLPRTGIAFAIATFALADLWTSTRVVADSGSSHTTFVLSLLIAIVGAGTGGAFAAAFVRIWLMKPVGVSTGEAHVQWFLIAPALGLALFSCAIAIVPGGLTLASGAAASLVVPRAATVIPHAMPITWLAPLGAAFVAWAILSRSRGVRRVRIGAMRSGVYRAFHAVDNGDSGAYIAWIVGAAAVLAFALSFAQGRGPS